MKDKVDAEVCSWCAGKKCSAKLKENPASSQQSKTKAGTTRGTFEVDLPEAEAGKVKLRFAPEPSGYLHIGHSKAALLNQYFAQRYQGQLITLGIKYEKVTHTSDHFGELMDMTEELINQGKAYVDDTPREEMQKQRMDGIESKCRNHSKEENLKLWEEMKAGSERGLHCCVRGKLDMQDPNKSLRDPVYYVERGLYDYTLLSKRKLLWFVQNDKVNGWDDPRFPTVQGIVRRGLKVEALIQFILEQGASKNLNLMEWDKLWTINKKIIDPVCPRHTAVTEEGRVLLTLSNGPEKPFVRIIPRHKKYEGAGEKATTFTRSI
ncbi:putative glutamate--tRNA ligase [Rosa chinensis]|uniref:Putative glutamate--tRNA ligase n=1 Tax=Rosa chinensis TaxID=74649 RepID=A0A2P6SB87_ROSCH|nr:putative glutamate--tRNA ligase [Rosa chinensis]